MDPSAMLHKEQKKEIGDPKLYHVFNARTCMHVPGREKETGHAFQSWSHHNPFSSILLSWVHTQCVYFEVTGAGL